ncbi:hypothetical protein BJY00DRAFT_316392 [Aspergillus carlsbadensis]|nr:hypothetical protein BJY00DRAFT_316392 [Aspergillus carlsbadensis]
MPFTTITTFLTSLKTLTPLTPTTIYRAHRNPFHIILLLLYYLILPILWTASAFMRLVIQCEYPYIFLYPKRARNDPGHPFLAKTSANGRDDLPVPLGVRGRALTMPLATREEGRRGVWARYRDRNRRQTEQVTYLQHQSPLFLTLPPEIRRMVYLEVIALPGRGELCISHAERRLYGFPAGERDEENPDLLGYPHSAWVGLSSTGYIAPETIPTLRDRRPPLGSEGLDEEKSPRRPGRFRVMGLLTSCRRIYTEAIDLLYTKTPLNIRCASTLLSLQSTTLPHRFESIRHLHVEKVLGVAGALDSNFTIHNLGDWKKACAAIGAIRDLRRLRVSFSRTHCEPGRAALLAYLAPLVQLRAAEFVVRFNWPAQAIVESMTREWKTKMPFEFDVHPPPPHSEAVHEIVDQ